MPFITNLMHFCDELRHLYILWMSFSPIIFSSVCYLCYRNVYWVCTVEQATVDEGKLCLVKYHLLGSHVLQVYGTLLFFNYFTFIEILFKMNI